MLAPRWNTILLALASSVLLPSWLLMALANPPEWSRARVAAPTVAAVDSPELADGTSGVLVAAGRSGEVTVVELPSRRTRRLDIGRRATMVAGPDEAGRIVYEARDPRWWEFFPFTMFTDDGEREALFVKSVHGGDARVLCDYRATGYVRNVLELSKRGGRVLYVVDGDARVFDVESGRMLFRANVGMERRDPWLDDDGEVLHFERIEPVSAVGPRIPYDQRRWLPICVDLASGEEREGCDARTRAASGFGWVKRSHWGRGPRAANELPTVEREHVDEREQLPGDIGGPAIEFNDGRTLYEGYARPSDGARGFRGYGTFEHSIRLGERSTGRTLTLAPRFESGVWTFSDVQLAP